MVALALRLRQSLPALTAQGARDKDGRRRGCLVNGLNLAVVGLSFWPAALACQRAAGDSAERALAEVAAAAEACGHPPTQAYVLAHLCREYYRVVCDPARGADAAARAEALAAAHGLDHCGRCAAVCASRRAVAPRLPGGASVGFEVRALDSRAPRISGDWKGVDRSRARRSAETPLWPRGSLTQPMPGLASAAS